jgi:hypothetical protein
MRFERFAHGSLTSFLAVVIAIAVAIPVLGADTQNKTWGTSKSPTASQVQPTVSLGHIAPGHTPANPTMDIPPSSLVFPSSQYATGGVALRNRKTGNIAVSGLTGGATAAFLYWGVITFGPPGLSVSTVTLARIYPKPSVSAPITGVAVGTGPSPCWPGDRITIFRAGIPVPALVTGNGSYQITLKAGGSDDGGDPWVEPPVLPLWEGASLVVVAPGSGTVAIYDTGLAGNTFSFGLFYTLDLPFPASGFGALLDNIGADGQIGSSRTAFFTGETTFMNGVEISGPFGLNRDSDWDGSSGWPLPQLWDDTGHDITFATPSGTVSLNVFINGVGDCVTPAVNVVQIQ